MAFPESPAKKLQKLCQETLCRDALTKGVELSVQAYEAHVLTLESIWSHQVRGGGRASAVLEALCQLADQHGVTLKLHVYPLHYGFPLGDGDESEAQNAQLDEAALSSKHLEAWYARQGFVRKPGTDPQHPTMLRAPRKDEHSLQVDIREEVAFS